MNGQAKDNAAARASKQTKKSGKCVGQSQTTN